MSHTYSNPSSVTPMHLPPQSAPTPTYPYTKQAAPAPPASAPQRGAHEPIVEDIITDNTQVKQAGATGNKSAYIKQYRRGKFLGKGGFAYVYEMTSVDSQRVYAGKVVAKSSITKPSSKTKLLNEIRIHRQLNQQYIVKFERFFEDRLNVYILLELCPHMTLMELVKRRKRLSEVECIYFMSQLISALQHLHTSFVIHRDLKLGNLFLSENTQGGLELKVGDFGLATKLEHAEERKKTLCGTPNYIAPEILDNSNADGHSFEVDIWALGVIMYTLLVGSPPFETESVKTTYRRIRDNVYDFPAHVQVSQLARSLIQRILHSDPQQRPSLDSIATDPFFSQPNLHIPKHLPVSALHTPYVEPRAVIENNENMPIKANMQTKPLDIGKAGSVASSPRKRAPFADRQNTLQNTQPPALSRPASIQQPTPVAAQPLAQQPAAAASSRPGSGAQSRPVTRSLSRQISIPTTAVITPSAFAAAAPAAIQSSEPVVETQADDVDVDEQNEYKKLNADIERSFCAPRTATTGQTNKPASKVLQPATVWITQWVDYSNKYGMGYLLNSGQTGMYFNDATKILLHNNNVDIHYYERFSASAQNAAEPAGEAYTVHTYPAPLQKKVTLVKHFNGYLINQAKSQGVSDLDALTKQAAAMSIGKPATVVYVKKWMKTKHATFFRLSNRTVQVQFEDNTEVIVDPVSNSVTYTDKTQVRSVHPIDVESSQRPDLTKRMQYTKSILEHLMNKQ